MNSNHGTQLTEDKYSSVTTDIEFKEPLTLAQIIALQFAELQTHFSTVVADTSVEAIHKMRVTTRRLQASLDLIKFKDDSAGIGDIRKELRTLRRMLSEVRNYDVFLILLDKEASNRKTIQEPFESLKAELLKRRSAKSDEIKSFLKKTSIKKIAKKLRLNYKNPEMASLDYIADEQRIALHTGNRLEKRLIEFQELAENIEPTNHPEELHQLRIAAKRLRYLLEIAADMGYGQSVTALNWLRSLQDRIGDWHDLEAMETEVIKIVAHRKFVKSHLKESSSILTAAVHLQKKKLALINRLFPIKISQNVISASLSIIKAFRIDAEDAL